MSSACCNGISLSSICRKLRELIRKTEVREKDRVVLACMKNAGGNVLKLKANLNDASGWYRELLGEAEYPFYMKKIFRIDLRSEDEKAKIIEKDKNQYLTSLNRDAPRSTNSLRSERDS
jgi:hypothetical protein